ncbi:MAG: helix-hairpin-helix domain-containing protein [Bacteroidaceae bacterium]|nr:helix-hairpin-helix domain-containing protein [Bacteroidaceae bacterium]
MKKNPFKEFFYFSKSERRAIVALGCIAVFAIGVLMVLDRPSSQPSPSMEKEVMQGVEGKPDERPEVVLQTFDPNTVDSLTLIHFGLKPWKVKNFLHYRAAGKVFRSAEDLGDTYGWTAEDVEMLASYVRVGKQYEKKEKKREEREQWGKKEEKPDHISKKFQSLTKVDVNTADTATLRRIPGVGAKISDAIVHYRKRLGGFHSVEQLREISIVSPELLEWFSVSSSPALQKFNINKASFQALNSHPYISYEQTKALLQYIRLYGNVKDEETLLATGIFTKEEVEKLKPYIAYE